MNSAVHRADGLEDRQTDREINLSATLILGIFFALSLVCAVFFAFGYSVGRKSAAGAPGGVPIASVPPVQTPNAFGGFKPAAGSTSVAKPGPTVTVPMDPVPTVPKAVFTGPTQTESFPETTVKAAPPESGNVMVQVAAVSHQEDADLLVTTLKRRGYAVAIHNEAQDKLLHVQVGPFTSHKDADVIRQKLLSDGFNAIVKEQK